MAFYGNGFVCKFSNWVCPRMRVLLPLGLDSDVEQRLSVWHWFCQCFLTWSMMKHMVSWCFMIILCHMSNTLTFFGLCIHISRRTGNRARKNNVFLKKIIFAIAKQTFLQPELCQILVREFGKIRVSCGFWIHFIGACWQFFFFLFKAGASALKLFFAGDGYADSDSHISSTASIT